MSATIYWQCQTISSVPDDLDWLSVEEQGVYSQLRFPKRKKEWLSGRYVAKTLLKRINSKFGAFSLDEMTVRNMPDGSPFIASDDVRLLGSLSISHRSSLAAAAWCERSNYHIGIDLEAIELKSKGFIEDYFTESEARVVLNLPDEMLDLAASLIWSGKEAVLKALQIGLRVDTRNIELALPDLSKFSSEIGWSRMEVRFYPAAQGSMDLYSRLMGDYVITLAIMCDEVGPQIPTDRIIQLC